MSSPTSSHIWREVESDMMFWLLPAGVASGPLLEVSLESARDPSNTWLLPILIHAELAARSSFIVSGAPGSARHVRERDRPPTPSRHILQILSPRRNKLTGPALSVLRRFPTCSGSMESQGCSKKSAGACAQRCGHAFVWELLPVKVRKITMTSSANGRSGPQQNRPSSAPKRKCSGMPCPRYAGQRGQGDPEDARLGMSLGRGWLWHGKEWMRMYVKCAPAI